MQTIDTLNSRYGAPGRIVFHPGFAGHPNVVLANKYGSAEIALLGATTLSYRPTGHAPVIFRPAKGDADYRRGERPHGGIPVCWPQFGNRMSKDLPKHGFASVLLFDVRGTEYSDEITEITLGVKSDDETKKIWPHDFDLEVKISVSMKLNLTLTTKNTGDAPFEFSAAFHPYFLLRDRDAASSSVTSMERPAAISRQFVHSPHGSTPRGDVQFSAFAKMRESVVLPMPRGPMNR